MKYYSMGGHKCLPYTKVSQCTKWRWGRELLIYIEKLTFTFPPILLNLLLTYLSRSSTMRLSTLHVYLLRPITLPSSVDVFMDEPNFNRVNTFLDRTLNVRNKIAKRSNTRGL